MSEQPTKRHLGPDVVRGVAVLLMFLVNAPGVLGGLLYDSDARFDPASLAGGEALGWGIIMTLPAIGGMAIFAGLMGFGIAPAMVAGVRRSLREHRRVWARFVVIGAIGTVHVLLFWWGDILTTYAVVGVCALLFAGLHVSLMRAWAIALFAVPCIFAVTSALAVIGPLADDVRAVLQRTSLPDGLDRATALAVYQDGGLADVLRYRAKETLYFEGQFLPLAAPQILGALLLGVTGWRRGWFLPNAAWLQNGARRGRLVLGTGIGLCLLYTIALLIVQDPLSPWLAAADAARIAGAPLFGLGIVMLALTWAASARRRGLQQRFAAVGRLTLSLYLAQTVSLSLLCYALPVYGEVGRLGQVLVGLAYGALALLVAPLWLARHRRGPIETIVDRGASLIVAILPQRGPREAPVSRRAPSPLLSGRGEP